MKKSKKQAAVGFIFITVLLDVIGWGIIIPVIPNLIKELINGDISEAAKIGGWLTFAYAITQFIFAPLFTSSFIVSKHSFPLASEFVKATNSGKASYLVVYSSVDIIC